MDGAGGSRNLIVQSHDIGNTVWTGAHYPELPSSILPSESTLSRIFLFLEAPPTGFFAGVYLIASHERAVVLYRLRHMQAGRKYLIVAKSAESLPFFWGYYANVHVFSREIKEPPMYLSSKIKKIRDRVDSSVQLVWRLRVTGSSFGLLSQIW